MTIFVVYVDSNPANVRAFFALQAEAVAWRDANAPAGEVREAEVDSYRLVTEQTITL